MSTLGSPWRENGKQEGDKIPYLQEMPQGRRNQVTQRKWRNLSKRRSWLGRESACSNEKSNSSIRKEERNNNNKQEELVHHHNGNEYSGVCDNFCEHFNIRDFLHTDRMSEEEINYCGFWTTANRITRQSGKENFEGGRIPVNDQWDLNHMEQWLEGYDDANVMEFIRYGWPLNNEATAENDIIPPNQAGARQHPAEIREYLNKERSAGSIISPFKKNPFGRSARFSPLDTRPKKDTDELRIILNLSYPHGGESINSSINKTVYVGKDEMNLHYPSVDNFAKLIRKKNKQVRIFKRDLSKAYHQLFMSPNSIQVLGYWFEDECYFDVTLSMGSSSAAYCCQCTTNAISYIYSQFGFEDINYLDDLGAAEVDKRAEEAYNCLGWILDTIGIRESKSKACPPAYIHMHHLPWYIIWYHKHDDADHSRTFGWDKFNSGNVDKQEDSHPQRTSESARKTQFCC